MHKPQPGNLFVDSQSVCFCWLLQDSTGSAGSASKAVSKKQAQVSVVRLY